MGFTAGTRVGPYEILALIGAGGMGEVYRARDSRLGRDVAVKVLPSDVAGDSERLARFRREAYLLASLNHPGIAAIYGLEEFDGKPCLILEQRIRTGACCRGRCHCDCEIFFRGASSVILAGACAT